MDPNERAFYDKVFQVLRNFMEYGNYQKKQENAIKVLIKAFPDKSKEELRELFIAYCSAYTEAVVLVQENLPYYAKTNDLGIPPAENDYRKKYAAINQEMLTWIIGWIHNWYHER